MTATGGGTICYGGGILGSPAPGSATTSNGQAFVINAAVGTVTVGATKSGTTFSSHDIKTYASSVTESVIEP